MGKRPSNWWHLYFLAMAKFVSIPSKDPSTRVGAVIVDNDRRPVSWGYNGFAQNVKDTEERLSNREVKLKCTLHAEDNAINFARTSLKGCSIYVYPFSPCAQCASRIIQSGIKAVYAPYTTNELFERWTEDLLLARAMFDEAHLVYREFSRHDIP